MQGWFALRKLRPTPIRRAFHNANRRSLYGLRQRDRSLQTVEGEPWPQPADAPRAPGRGCECGVEKADVTSRST
jgi:hypothetical protein